jgi:hypothetical protein
MKSGWVGGITNYAEATVNSGEQFAGFIEKGDVFAFIGKEVRGASKLV